MHIVYIYSEIAIKGGADKVIVEKANYFVQHGYEVTIITESQMGREMAFPLDAAVKHIDMNLDFNSQYNKGFFRRAYTYYTLMRQYKKKLNQVLCEIKPDIVIIILVVTHSADCHACINLHSGCAIVSICNCEYIATCIDGHILYHIGKVVEICAEV